MHTCMYRYMHAYILTCIHTYMHTSMQHACMHTSIEYLKKETVNKHVCNLSVEN